MRKSFPWNTWLFYILGFIALFIILNVFSLGIRSAFFRFTLPLQSFFWEKGTGFSNFLDGIVQGGRFKKENVLLQERIEVLQVKLAEFGTLQRENESLRNALDIGLLQEFKLLGANVVGKEISRDVIFIDRGSADGIAKGMAVITPSRVVAGQVIETYEHSSKVRLLSDTESSFEASVRDMVGVVRGMGRSQILLDLIPQDKDIQKGDVVVTSHLGSVFSPNLPIGEIQEVGKNDAGTFQQASVRLFFDMSRDSLLFVIFQP